MPRFDFYNTCLCSTTLSLWCITLCYAGTIAVCCNSFSWQSDSPWGCAPIPDPNNVKQHALHLNKYRKTCCENKKNKTNLLVSMFWSFPPVLLKLESSFINPLDPLEIWLVFPNCKYVSLWKKKKKKKTTIYYPHMEVWWHQYTSRLYSCSLVKNDSINRLSRLVPIEWHFSCELNNIYNWCTLC